VVYKPPNMEYLGRHLKMKFLIRDTGRTQLFDGQITTYDGLTGKYGVYFPCDGKTVYIYLDDKDVIFS